MMKHRLGALVVAAGSSRRMGSFKLLLPWRQRTVVGQVVATLVDAGLSQILVVTGWRGEEVAQALAGQPVRVVPNPRWAEGEMLSSIQAGLHALTETGNDCPAALICLGDQPQMQLSTVAAILAAGEAANWLQVVVPSYQMHAGHPILLPRWLWPEVLATPEPLRSVLAARRDCIDYVTVDTPTITADLDTPEDYARERAAADLL